MNQQWNKNEKGEELWTSIRTDLNFYESFADLLKGRKENWACKNSHPTWQCPLLFQQTTDLLLECLLNLKVEMGTMEDALNHIDPKWRSRGWIKDQDFPAHSGDTTNETT